MASRPSVDHSGQKRNKVNKFLLVFLSVTEESQYSLKTNLICDRFLCWSNSWDRGGGAN